MAKLNFTNNIKEPSVNRLFEEIKLLEKFSNAFRPPANEEDATRILRKELEKVADETRDRSIGC